MAQLVKECWKTRLETHQTETVWILSGFQINFFKCFSAFQSVAEIITNSWKKRFLAQFLHSLKKNFNPGTAFRRIELAQNVICKF